MPHRFTEDMILAAPSRNVMNKLERSILALYSYDPSPEPSGIAKELQQALGIIARCPTIVAHAYAAKKYYFDKDSLYLHVPQREMSLAENFMYSIRPDKTFTEEEARILDLCLVLHAEHGGGNNSAFTCRVLSSAGTDIYSALAAAVGSLKGPRHGGANLKANEMYRAIKSNVRDWDDEDELKAFLLKLLSGEAGDRSGLIYGMGHAIYTLSDPRALILKEVARNLAEKKGFKDEFRLYENVESLTKKIFAERGRDRPICANVDMFSGFVYNMLGIPEDLFTPLFAIARMAGWCAHRIEEMYNPNKIIRPAYKAIKQHNQFVPMDER
jgi:citrate synthase